MALTCWYIIRAGVGAEEVGMVLAVWDGDAWKDLAVLGGVIVGAYLVVLWLAALVWVYRDAAARSRDPFIQVLATALVAVFSLPGLFLYLIVRPQETIADRYDRQLEAQALLNEIKEQPACPACRRRVSEDYVTCPYCRAALRTPCESCSKPLASGWIACPWCGVERVTPVASPRADAGVERSESAPRSGPKPRRASTATYTPAAKPQPSPAADASVEPGS